MNKLTNLYINSTVCDKKERVKEHLILIQIVKHFCDDINLQQINKRFTPQKDLTDSSIP